MRVEANFQTLIATKAAVSALSSKMTPAVEFGTRRAQEMDAAICRGLGLL